MFENPSCVTYARKYLQNILVMTCKGKEISLQARTGPEDSRRLRIPDFKTIGT
jgi:hypothetical protein